VLAALARGGRIVKKAGYVGRLEAIREISV